MFRAWKAAMSPISASNGSGADSEADTKARARAWRASLSACFDMGMCSKRDGDMSRKLIAVIPGDGIGPEVIAQAVRLLELVKDQRKLPIDLWQLDLGADRYLKDGTTFPKEVSDRIKNEASAVLLGALGDPRVPRLEHARDILFGIRFGFDLYANIRPVKALSDRLVPLKNRGKKDVDFVVFRENTEGIY